MAQDILLEIFLLSSLKGHVFRMARKWDRVAVSPRGDLRMPSDASANLWMRELDEIKASAAWKINTAQKAARTKSGRLLCDTPRQAVF